ncbi:uncharacterized protein BDR25DRAFT_359729 [Lindgomyces ingoldianus]|uniref:Uncharacterized protein n=1 Tax=Lindgomyces ingoldianus TaxID=673940 RepID=A0ACB6QHL6_9PLEO|nr:uncharacterized protein BDR25DRAFT_359729 [Lindgomyces ingoldianus]KAF2466380.1 hypothetical protein BDR25DRAFT_359729 [Lindgomyces ingoldianus]
MIANTNVFTIYPCIYLSNQDIATPHTSDTRVLDQARYSTEPSTGQRTLMVLTSFSSSNQPSFITYLAVEEAWQGGAQQFDGETVLSQLHVVISGFYVPPRACARTAQLYKAEQTVIHICSFDINRDGRRRHSIPFQHLTAQPAMHMYGMFHRTKKMLANVWCAVEHQCP